jgi:6-phosphofructokinase 1
MNTHTLGELRFASTLSHTISDDVRIPERIEIGADPGIKFEMAGPRSKLLFDPKQTRAGIVTCGGLCPSLQAKATPDIGYNSKTDQSKTWLTFFIGRFR